MSARRVQARLRALLAVLGAAPIVALSVAVAPVTASAAGLTRDIARAGTASFTVAPEGVVNGVDSPELFGPDGAGAAAQPAASRVVNRQQSREGGTGDAGGGEERDQIGRASCRERV